MNRTIMGLIRNSRHLFSESQNLVADYVLANPDKVILLSIAELAMSCNVSEPTVIRFLHKMSYQSYQVFRVNIAQELAKNPSQSLYSDVTEHDTGKEIMEKVIASTKQSLDDLVAVLAPEGIEKLCAAIVNAKKIFVIGVGSTYAIAYDFYHKLLKLGYESSCSNDPHIINICCNNMDAKSSILIAISHSGESREILDGVQLAKRSRCPVYSITSFPNSSLAKLADERILSTSLETSYRSDAMTSRIIQLCIIDMVYIRLAVMSGAPAIEKINASRVAVAHNKT